MESLMARFIQVVRFLATLVGCSLEEAFRRPLTFQLFTDPTPRPKPDPLARIIHASLKDCGETIERLNRQRAGAFVCVNLTDLRGRRKANILKIVGYHADLDFKDAVVSVSFQIVMDALPIRPTMVVRTPGGLHLYWLLVAPLSCEGEARWVEHEAELKAIQRYLARFGADSNACTIERVLRVPGFSHHKADPQVVELVQSDGPRYSREQIRDAFGITELETVLKPALVTPTVHRSTRGGNEGRGLLERAARYLDTLPGGVEGNNGSKTTFVAALKTITHFDLSVDEALDLMARIHNPKCVPEWSMGELMHKVECAWNKAQTSPHLGDWAKPAWNPSMTIPRPADSNKASQPSNPPPQVEKPSSHVENPAPQVVPRATNPTWKAPEPIKAELLPVPEFTPELLPEAIRGWVLDEGNRMPCPIEFVAVAFLVSLGAAAGAQVAIHPKALDSWAVVPNLWGGIVGPPSAKKTPALSSALAPLEFLIEKASEAFKKDQAVFSAENIIRKALQSELTKRIEVTAIKSGKADAQSLSSELVNLDGQFGPVPIQKRYKTNDCTVEKLGELLRDNPAGLMVLRDELVGLIDSWDREGREGDRTFFLEGWNGTQPFVTDRIGRGTITIPNLCISIIGGIQPDKLVAYLEHATHSLANDGMLQRFQLLVFPNPRRWEWRDMPPDKLMRERIFSIFEAVATLDPVAWGATPKDDSVRFPFFRFDEAAQEVFIRWSADLHLNKLPNEDQPIIAQHLAKYDKLFPALALVFHLLDCAARGTRGAVTVESALLAEAWCEYLEAHARRCYGLLLDDGLRAAQAIAAKLKVGRLSDGFTVRDVRRHQWRGLTTDESIQAALDWLEDCHWIKSEEIGGTGPGTGRRTTRYRINPSIRERDEGESGRED